jgi:hypothetical protein
MMMMMMMMMFKYDPLQFNFQDLGGGGDIPFRELIFFQFY